MNDTEAYLEFIKKDLESIKKELGLNGCILISEKAMKMEMHVLVPDNYSEAQAIEWILIILEENLNRLKNAKWQKVN